MFYKNYIKLTIFIVAITHAVAWDTEELEIFDLVEEIKDNFYGFLGVQQDATLQEIKRAFRNLSIVLHPDKNDAEDANIQFRNLVSIYEVLKDPGKREKYNDVLKNGLPNWKSALYYYRHVRKMGLVEMSIILFVIITIGQYFVSWAAYIEKKYTAEQVFGSKLKKLQKKNKSNINIDEILKEIPAPSIKDTLPFQIPRAIWNTPRTIRDVFAAYREHKQAEDERKQREFDEAEEARLYEEELAKEKESKGMRKRKPLFVAPEKTEEELSGYTNPLARAEPIHATNTKPVISGGIWTDEDLVELTRLIKKYPGGTTDRWELIADALYRNVSEVTHMAAKLKENGYRVNAQTESVAESLAPKKKEKTKKPDQIMVPEATWSQEQQQALESAIVKYPKTSSADRWQKISHCVPGKTKEECLLRYKYLVELVKMQRQQAAQEASAESVPDEPEPQPDSEPETIKEVGNVKPSKKKQQGQQQKLVNGGDEVAATNKGKKRNLRKERKRNMDFSTDEESDYSDDNNELA